MRRLKVVGLAFVAMVVLGAATAAAASAESTPLPDIHTALPGETYPLHLEGKAEQTNENDIAFESATSKLTAESVELLLLASELTSLGLALIDFKGANDDKSGEKCSTTGDLEGVVLIPNAEFHLVYTGLSPNEVLATAALILFPRFQILCGPFVTVAEPPLMSRTVPVPLSNGDSRTIETATHCSKPGVQELSSYFNDKLELLTGQLLELNISGTGLENACLEIKGTLLLTVLDEKMFTVLE